MPVTWNPADKNAGIALTGSNLIATSSAGSGTVNQAVRATQPISPAVRQYFEVTFSSPASAQYYAIGVMDGSLSLAGNVGIGNTGSGSGFYDKFNGGTSAIYTNGVGAGTYPVLSNGQVIRVAIDRARNKMWWAINNNTWSGAAVWMGSGGTTDDPATNTGGSSLSSVTGTLYPAMSSAWTGDTATINAAAPFAYAVPSGFLALDNTPTGVNAIWNQYDAASGLSLDSTYLIATNTTNTTTTVRATISRSSGKYYWEYTCTTFLGTSSGVGIEVSTASLSVNVASAVGGITGACGVSRLGQLAVDGGSTITVGGVGSQTVSFGTIVNGTVICVAIDLTARLVWFRLGAAGNWNNSAGRDPAAATGGAAIPNLGAGVQSFPAATVANTNDQVTANFGDTAFVGAVPSGFAAGFPGTVAAGVQGARVMVLA